MLTLRDVRKSYRNVAALDGVTLSCAAGEVLALLGPNGAGKTTTLAIASGVLRADAGEIDIAGVGSPATRAARRRLGVVPQDVALYDVLTAEQNLRCFGSLWGVSGRAELRRRVDVALGRVGLSGRARSRVETFSGGMKRRLNLAAALVHEPAVLLLDEATVGVDPHSRSSILDLVRELRDEGKAVIFSTHYIEEAERVADRVAIIDRGSVIAAGTVDELVRLHAGPPIATIESESGVRRLRLTDPAAELPDLLREPGVRGLRVDRPSLEAVFMTLTGRSLRD